MLRACPRLRKPLRATRQQRPKSFAIRLALAGAIGLAGTTACEEPEPQAQIRESNAFHCEVSAPKAREFSVMCRAKQPLALKQVSGRLAVRKKIAGTMGQTEILVGSKDLLEKPRQLKPGQSVHLSGKVEPTAAFSGTETLRVRVIVTSPSADKGKAAEPRTQALDFSFQAPKSD